MQKEYFHFVAALSNFFCWIEGAWGKVVVVATSFCSPFEKIVKKLNFAVWDTTLRHILGGIVVRTTSHIL